MHSHFLWFSLTFIYTKDYDDSPNFIGVLFHFGLFSKLRNHYFLLDSWLIIIHITFHLLVLTDAHNILKKIRFRPDSIHHIFQ